MKIKIDWDWEQFGIGIAIWKNAEINTHKIGIDIQILFLDIWMVLIKKNNE